MGSLDQSNVGKRYLTSPALQADEAMGSTKAYEAFYPSVMGELVAKFLKKGRHPDPLNISHRHLRTHYTLQSPTWNLIEEHCVSHLEKRLTHEIFAIIFKIFFESGLAKASIIVQPVRSLQTHLFSAVRKSPVLTPYNSKKNYPSKEWLISMNSVFIRKEPNLSADFPKILLYISGPTKNNERSIMNSMLDVHD